MSTANLINKPRAKLTDLGIETSASVDKHSDDSSLICCLPQSVALNDSTQVIPYCDIVWIEQVAAPGVQKLPRTESSTSLSDSELLSGTSPFKITYLHKKSPVSKVVELDVDESKKYLLSSVSSSKNSGVVSVLEHEEPQKPELVRLLFAKCYENASKFQPKVMVLINPNGGKGFAIKKFKQEIKPIFDAAHIDYTIFETRYYRHCLDLIQTEDFSKFDIIACCSGDGIPHEVINGIYKRKDRTELFNRLIVTQLPCGSGNALSISCHKTMNAAEATLSMLKSPMIKMDLMKVIQNDTESLSFLSQTYGIIADADIGTEFMRWVGPVRFDLGVAYKLLSNAKYPCDVYVKYQAKHAEDVHQAFKDNLDKNTNHIELTDADFESGHPKLSEPVPSDWEKVSSTDTLSVIYTGKMPYIADEVQFFPGALPNDGCFDLVIMNANTDFAEKAKIFLNLDSGKHFFHDEVMYSKVQAIRLIPKKHNYISVDGENFPLEPMQVEIVPNVLNLIAKDGRFKETILHK